MTSVAAMISVKGKGKLRVDFLSYHDAVGAVGADSGPHKVIQGYSQP